MLNGQLRLSNEGVVDTFDISTAESGAILAATSDKEIKILDSNGALTETITIDNRVKLAKFAPNSDKIVILALQEVADSDMRA